VRKQPFQLEIIPETEIFDHSIFVKKRNQRKAGMLFIRFNQLKFLQARANQVARCDMFPVALQRFENASHAGVAAEP
jgi:hypothetical protein